MDDSIIEIDCPTFSVMEAPINFTSLHLSWESQGTVVLRIDVIAIVTCNDTY